MIKEANFEELKEMLSTSIKKLKEANILFKDEKVLGDMKQLEEISSLISNACMKARKANDTILEVITDLAENAEYKAIDENR